MVLRRTSCRIVCADSAAPAELLVFAAGRGASTHGDVWTIDAASAKSIIEHFNALGRDLVIDYEHQTLGGEYASPTGQAPAAGWIKSLTWDAARGLVANVQWTSRAADMIAGGEYRYHSPVFSILNGRIQELHSVAITNDPATLDIQPIAASRLRAAKMPGRRLALAGATRMDELKAQLGLAPEATAEDVLAAITPDNLEGVAAMLGVEPTMDAVKAALMPAASNTPAPDAPAVSLATLKARFNVEGDDADAVLRALGNRISNPKGMVPVTEHQKLQAEVKALKDRADDAEFDVVLSRNPGKVPPAATESWRKVFKTDRAMFDAMLESQPVIASSKTVLQGEETDGSAKAIADFDAKVAEIAANGKPRHEAIREATRRNPEAAAKWSAAKNKKGGA